MYLAGLGVPQDLVAAEQWIEKAAAQGYADALAVQVDALASRSGGIA
jgi:TPR repeat protein